MPTGQELRTDEDFVESQGQILTLLNRGRARATWYKPDGKAIPNLPVDMYHRTLYRNKGWTLVAPEQPRLVAVQPLAVQDVEAEAEHIVKEYATPPPPKHIHVMLAEIGSPCLVQGCTKVRQKPPIAFKKTGHRNKSRRIRETNNA